MMRVALLVALLVACRDELVLPEAGDGVNAAPLALAGVGTIVQLGTTVLLDGSASFDPDGDALTYEWRRIQAPLGSTATLSSTSTATSSFVADMVGTYRFALDVRDEDGATSHDEVAIDAVLEVVLPNLSVDAGPDTTIEWFARGEATATITAADGYTPTYAWTMTGRPFYSTATLVNATTLTPSFVADAQGAYTLTLTATAGSETRTDTVVVTASTPGKNIGEGAIAYSAALDRFVVLKNQPVTISVIDPVTGLGPTMTVLDLYNSSSFELHPLGLRVAIGTSQRIVTVNLQTLAVENVSAVSPQNETLVFAHDDRVHSIPTFDDQNIRTIDLAAGTVSEAPSFGQFPSAVLHPSGTAMYLVDGATSSLARYDITSTPIARVREATAASLGGPTFITADGGYLISSTGIVLRSSTTAALDMTYHASLGTTHIESLAHSTITHEIATVNASSTGPDRVSWFDDATFTRRFTAMFVEPTSQNEYWNSVVAYRADGARMYLAGYRPGGWRVFAVSPPP